MPDLSLEIFLSWAFKSAFSIFGLYVALWTIITLFHVFKASIK
jgi:hypothetical protein